MRVSAVQGPGQVLRVRCGPYMGRRATAPCGHNWATLDGTLVRRCRWQVPREQDADPCLRNQRPGN